MLRKGQGITLRPYKTFKNNPEKDEPIGYGSNDKGEKFIKFQIIDYNTTTESGKMTTGFAYVDIFTDLPLKVGDYVSIKDILYVQIKAKRYRNPITIIGITIEQTSPDEPLIEEPIEDYSLPDFGV